MPFWNQWKEENERKDDFMINIYEYYVTELATPGSAVRRATDCAMKLDFSEAALKKKINIELPSHKDTTTICMCD